MRSFSFISRNFLLSMDAKPGLQIQPIETFRDLWVELRIQRYDLNQKCEATCQQWSEVGLGKGSQVADIKKSGMFSFAVFLLRLYWHFQCSSIFTFYFNFFLLCLFFFNILKSEQNLLYTFHCSVLVFLFTLPTDLILQWKPDTMFQYILFQIVK